MNERIKQLIEQAGAKELGADLYGGEFIGAIRLDFLEKFAEFLIKECAEIADYERPNSIGCGYITKTKGTMIKEHFGVK